MFFWVRRGVLGREVCVSSGREGREVRGGGERGEVFFFLGRGGGGEGEKRGFCFFFWEGRGEERVCVFFGMCFLGRRGVFLGVCLQVCVFRSVSSAATAFGPDRFWPDFCPPEWPKKVTAFGPLQVLPLLAQTAFWVRLAKVCGRGGPETWGTRGVRNQGPAWWGPNPEWWGPEGLGARRVGSPKFRAFCTLPPGRRGLHKMTPEKPKRAIWVVHGLKPRPQVHEKTPESERKE